MFFNRTQSEVIGFLARHNTLRRHLHLMGLTKQRMKPLPTFSVSVKLWLHFDLYIWVLSFWTQRVLQI